jgi:hypothetical protein
MFRIPLLPETAEPEPIKREPLFEFNAYPLLNVTAPLNPIEVSEVDKINAPLPLPEPVTTDIRPPAAADDCPALKISSPPLPLLAEPIVMYTAPPRPLLAEPVDTYSAPLFPDDEVPDCR